eukprot:8815505-Pyramimonas_sp.AAC.1
MCSPSPALWLVLPPAPAQSCRFLDGRRLRDGPRRALKIQRMMTIRMRMMTRRTTTATTTSRAYQQPYWK